MMNLNESRMHSGQQFQIAISKLKYKVTALGMLCGWMYKQNSVGW